MDNEMTADTDIPPESTKEKRAEDYFFRASAEDFKKIPGSPIAYWVSPALIKCFETSNSFENEAPTRKGMVTAQNDIYVRLWHEISTQNSGFDRFFSRQKACDSKHKWFSYLKGGGFRKWYGNKKYVVNWKNDGFDLQNAMHPKENRVWATNFNLDYIFKENVNWGAVTSSSFSARISYGGELFDAGGSACFSNSLSKEFIVAYLNSQIAQLMLKTLNPTLNFQAGNISNIPLQTDIDIKKIENLSNKSIEISKNDWDSFEYSWDFSRPYILYKKVNLLQDSYNSTIKIWNSMVNELQANECSLNKIFAENLHLQKDIRIDVPLNEITLTCNPHYRYGPGKTQEEYDALLLTDTMKELISYAIGCMMGRYSLDEPGLIYAHSGNKGFDSTRYTTFPADDDGIVPVMDMEWFEDDASKRFEEFLRVAWNEETLEENLEFVADALSPKRGEEPRETIRRFISTSFFKDHHLKVYKKRPIYWLFSSGKNKAFECLVYLHRYNENTLSRMRAMYVTPLQGKYATLIQYLQEEKEKAPSAAAAKKYQKQLATMLKKQEELRAFDELLRHYADQRITLDLDDGVKVNYGKFGKLLAEVKAVTGKKAE